MEEHGQGDLRDRGERLYGQWLEIEARNWPWRQFKPSEMACRGTGRLLLVPSFMDRLQQLRAAFRVPLIVTSGYRSPEYNAQVSSTGLSGPHTTGRAVDIAIFGGDAIRLTLLAGGLGFTGIGWKQSGLRLARFVHLDDLPDTPEHPRPWAWTY